MAAQDDPAAEIYLNNILAGNSVGLHVNFYNFYNIPSRWANNVVFGGQEYAGVSDQTGVNGNVSADPLFACEPEGDFHLLAGSPGIDTGTNAAALLPATDFDGNRRVLAGTSNNVSDVDRGAYEFNPLNPPTPCLFIDCQTDIVVCTPAGQNSAVVSFPTPRGTPVARIKCSPPSGSTFNSGTNVVTCTATYGTNSESCSFNIVVVVVAPTITRQPHDLQVSAGGSTNLSIGVSGTPPMYYQWSYQGNPIDGANAATLTLSDAQAVNDWVYSVRAYNASGATNSGLARVRVLPSKPVMVSNPSSMTTSAGRSAQFAVVAAGSEPMRYQWFFDGRPLAGANKPQLSIGDVQIGNAGSYSAMVSNPNGAAQSRTAVLNVKSQIPYFVAQPSSATLPCGSNLTLSGTAAGSEPIHYQWCFDGKPVWQQTSGSLKLSKIARTAAGNYYLVAANLYGQATSAVAHITVAAPPQLTGGVANQSVNTGQR